jgi:hypothetical protein
VKFEDHLLQQELAELTLFLHSDPEWNDIRNAIQRKGVDLRTVQLVGFCEDEAENQYGCLVVNAREVISFKLSPDCEVSVWRKEQDLELVLEEWPALKVALQ